MPRCFCGQGSKKRLKRVGAKKRQPIPPLGEGWPQLVGRFGQVEVMVSGATRALKLTAHLSSMQAAGGGASTGGRLLTSRWVGIAGPRRCVCPSPARRGWRVAVHVDVGREVADPNCVLILESRLTPPCAGGGHTVKERSRRSTTRVRTRPNVTCCSCGASRSLPRRFHALTHRALRPCSSCGGSIPEALVLLP